MSSDRVPSAPQSALELVTDLRDELSADGALAQNEAWIRSVFAALDQAFCVCELVFGPDGEPVDYLFIETNELFEQYTGLQDAVGRCAYDLVPGLEPEWLQVYAQAALGGQVSRVQRGSEVMGRWFDVFVTPLHPRGRFALLFSDITEQRVALQALHESERRFRNMADNAPVMVWVTEADGSCSYLSRRWCDFTGQTLPSGLGSGWLDAVHPDDRDRSAAEFAAATAQRRPFRLDYRLRAADGEYRWALDAAAPRLDADGNFLGFIGSVIDISDRKFLEVALQHSETRFRLMANNLPMLVWVHDQDGALTFVNDTYCRFFGVSAEQMRHSAWQALTHPDDGAAYGAEFERCVRERQPFHAEVRVARADGEWRWIESWAQPQTDDSGEYLGHLGSSADITERKRHEEDLRLRHQEEHRVSLRLQEALLPRTPAALPGVEVAGRYAAASDGLEVGGDWYEVFCAAPGLVGVFVGDVVGHNIEAAAAMGQLRSGALALAAVATEPDQLVGALDQFAATHQITDFATVVCALLDPEDGSLSYSSAGHPPPVILHPDGSLGWLDGAGSLPLGVDPSGPRRVARAQLAPGSVLFAYTDGLIERSTEIIDAGLARLAEVLARHAHRDLEAMCDLVIEEMLGAHVQEDDIVVVAVRYTGTI